MIRRRVLSIGEIASENLHDPGTDIADMYLDSGVEKAYSGWTATDWIPVTAGRYLIRNASYATLNNANNSYNDMYGGNKAFNRRFAYMTMAGVVDCVLNIPDGVSYIRMSWQTEYIKNLEIYRLED